MKISKGQKKAISQNYKEMTLRELANETGLTEEVVDKYLKKKGKEAKQEIKQKEKIEFRSLKDLLMILKANWAFLLILFVGISLVFANALKGTFVSDDIATYVENTDLLDFDVVLRTRQVQTLFFYISYNTFGTNPIFLHSVSIITHYITVVLIFILFYARFGKKPAMIAATLFTVHPVITEAVSWVSGFNYELNAIRTVILLLLYSLYRNSGKKVYLFSAVAYFMIFNLISTDPWKLVIPATVVVWDQFILNKKIKAKEIISYLPLFVVSVLIFVLRLIPIATERIDTLYQHPEERSPFWLTFPYTIYMTFKLMVFPDKLTLYHEGEVLTPLFFNITRVFLVALIILVPILIKKNRKIAGIIMIIYASIIPALSPVQVAWFMAERYLYLGTAFFCLLVAYLFLSIEKKSKKKNVALIMTLVLFTAYSIRTIIRNVDWRTHKNLWFATYKVSPSSPKVHNNLGDIYTREKNYEMAIYHFAKSAEISPNFDAAHFNLARTYYLTRELDKSKQKFKDSLAVNPGLYQAYYMLGVIEFEDGNYDAAREYYLKVLSINPSDPDTLHAMQVLEATLAQ